MPDEALFHKNSSFGLEQTIETGKNWCIWGIFDRFISTHFDTVSPLPMLSKSQIFVLDWDCILNLGRKELEI